MNKKEYHLNDSKSFCMAPWVHLQIWPNGDTYPCCMTPMDFSLGNFQQSTLMELWNSEDMKNLRLNMLNDKKMESCQRCYELNDIGRKSVRNAINAAFKDSYDIVDTTNTDGSVDKLNLKYWDFRFSNICNFKCRSCGPQLSTAWFHDHEKLYGKKDNKTRQTYYSGGSAKKLWSEIEPLFDIVEEIYFAGGEPLIMEEHYKILKKLDEMKRYDVVLKYNTNFSELTYKGDNVLDLWNKFSHIQLGASLDANYERGEYMRKGQDWNKTIQNRKDVMKYTPHVKFFINCTLSVINCFNIVDFHKEWVELGFIGIDDFLVNMVLEPPHMRLQALPESIKGKLIDHYANHIDWFIASHNGRKTDGYFKSAINFINQQNLEHLWPEFCDLVKRVDAIRDENFVAVFPELNEIFIND